jgi:hypothetical protein
MYKIMNLKCCQGPKKDGKLYIDRNIDNVTDLIKALSVNGSIKTFQHAKIQGKLCFLCGLRQATIGTGFSLTSCYVTQGFLQ